MEPSQFADMFTWQIVLSYLSVQLLEWAKKSPLMPFVRQGEAIANRVVAGLLAAATVVGIQFSYDSTAGSLLITGLTLASVGQFLLEFVRSWAIQKVLYRTTIAAPPETTTPAPDGILS